MWKYGCFRVVWRYGVCLGTFRGTVSYVREFTNILKRNGTISREKLFFPKTLGHIDLTL